MAGVASVILLLRQNDKQMWHMNRTLSFDRLFGNNFPYGTIDITQKFG